MNRLKHHALIGLAMAAVGVPGLAQATYLESITLPGDVRVYSTQTPHVAPVERVFVNHPNNQGPSNAVKVVFTSGPAPSVSAKAEASAVGTQVSRAYVSAWMGYTFEVNGPANSYVPISFRGLFDIDNDSFLSYTNAQVYLSAATPANQRSESVGLWAQCDGSSLGPRCYADNRVGGKTTYSSLTATLGAVQAHGKLFGGSVQGRFQGLLMAPTDAAGHSRGSVSLYTTVSVADSILDGTPATSSAFIDPELRIDAGYLVLHPDAALTITPGVGNEITAVPEAHTAALMLCGLAGLLLTSRRRPAGAVR